MPVFYFKLEGTRGDKIVSLMTNLNENFGVTVKDALMVETDAEFLIPMLEKLQLEQDITPKQAEQENIVMVFDPMTSMSATMKKCLECGKLFGSGVGNFCSKKCYNKNYRERKKKSALPNQAQVDHIRNDEQARIDTVVAKAKQDTTSAFHQHTVSGPIMARKL